MNWLGFEGHGVKGQGHMGLTVFLYIKLVQAISPEPVKEFHSNCTHVFSITHRWPDYVSMVGGVKG